MREIPDKDVLISASVSCMNLYNLASQLPEVEAAGIELLHFDVVDGRFNDCMILGTPTLHAIRPHTTLPIEVHLAVYEPERYIAQFIRAGADYVAVHYEAMADPFDVFARITTLGAKPVLALRVETQVDESMLPLIEKAAWILKLTVNPGYSGQIIQPSAIESVRALRELLSRGGLDTPIQADGNMHPVTIPAVAAAGADIFTGGTSGLFIRDISIAEAARAMRRAAGG